MGSAGVVVDGRGLGEAVSLGSVDSIGAGCACEISSPGELLTATSASRPGGIRGVATRWTEALCSDETLECNAEPVRFGRGGNSGSSIESCVSIWCSDLVT